MKNLIKGCLFLALTGVIVSGCQKEDVLEHSRVDENTGSLPIECLIQQDFTYNYEVTIEGKVEGTYAKYRVSSNDQEMAMGMANELKSSSLNLLDDFSSLENYYSSDKVHDDTNYEEAPYDFEKGVHLVELERNIGDYKGYEVERTESLEKNFYVNSYSTITIQTTAGGIYVRNLWLYPNYNHHYFSDGTPGWNFDRMSTLSYYQDDTFTAGGYTAHYMVINPSYINSSFEHNNKIYWSIWP